VVRCPVLRPQPCQRLDHDAGQISPPFGKQDRHATAPVNHGINDDVGAVTAVDTGLKCYINFIKAEPEQARIFVLLGDQIGAEACANYDVPSLP
jgi:hypothetical protein